MSSDRCAACGRPVHIDVLDAKPSSAQFRGEVQAFGQLEALSRAADRGEEFDRLECEGCYGPGYISQEA